MLTVRKNTFETNSSSCHCVVVAKDDVFNQFVEGELFAEGAGYKFSYDAELIPIEEVHNRYCKYIEQENDFYRQYGNAEIIPLGIPAIKWILNNPDFNEVCPYMAGDVEAYLKEHDTGLNEETVNELIQNEDGLDCFRSWISLDYTPWSYSMLKKATEDFSTAYDEVESRPPHSVNGITSCYACWYI